jgi:hypothetical protein
MTVKIESSPSRSSSTNCPLATSATGPLVFPASFCSTPICFSAACSSPSGWLGLSVLAPMSSISPVSPTSTGSPLCAATVVATVTEATTSADEIKRCRRLKDVPPVRR